MENKDSHKNSTEKRDDSSLGKVLEPLMPVLKRALFTGAEMFFLTEEGLRKTLTDKQIPKDAVTYLIKQSEKSKDEFLNIFQRELKRFLSRIDITGLSKDVLDGFSVDLNATITLRRREDGNGLVAKVDHLKAIPRKKAAKRSKAKASASTKGKRSATATAKTKVKTTAKNKAKAKPKSSR